MQSTCGRNWNQIDCILLRDCLRCIIEEKAYSGIDCSSDHDLAGYIDLWGTIKIRNVWPDLGAFDDPGTKLAYNVEVGSPGAV